MSDVLDVLERAANVMLDSGSNWAGVTLADRKADAALLRELREAIGLLGSDAVVLAIQGYVEGMAVECPWTGFADAAVGLGRLASLLSARPQEEP